MEPFSQLHQSADHYLTPGESICPLCHTAFALPRSVLCHTCWVSDPDDAICPDCQEDIANDITDFALTASDT